MVLMGAGGHAIEVLQVLLDEEQQPGNLFFYDDTDNASKEILGEFPVIGSLRKLQTHFQKDPRFVLATGNPVSRKKLFDLAFNASGEPCNVLAKTVIKSKTKKISSVGLNFMHGVFVSENANIENGVLLNAFCHIHHDVFIGEYAEVSPKALILGKATVGKFTQIGAGAIILPKVKVGNNAIIGAGAVVTKDIPDNCVAFGIPAKVIRQNVV
jgi:sugar O-acyltransferase (sialic acid O-acetyltransferase NeuD family)